MQKNKKATKAQSLDIRDFAFRRLAEISPTGIYLTDVSGKCLYVNPAWCQMAGLTAEEAAGDGWLKAIHPDDRARINSEWNLFITGVIPWSSEYRFINPEGKTTWVSGSANTFSEKNGIKMGVIGVNLDITERKENEAKLQASEAEFRSLFENSLMGISQALPCKGLIRINKAYADLYGYPDIETMIAEAFVNTKVLYSNPGDRKRVLKILEKTGYMAASEFELVKRNGEKFWALVSARQVRDTTGNLLYLQAEHIDITEIKKLEAELRTSKNTLEALNNHLNDVREDERSQIAMNLHDDLGQRLTSLNLDLAWLKSRMGVQSQGVREKMEEMRSSIIETIESIREVSSFLRPTILYELGLVSAFTWQLKKFHKQTGIKFLFSHEPREFRIDDHISLILYRVFQESITNVVRHSEASVVEIVLIFKENLITLSIYDNGIGIDEDKINSIKSLGIAGLRERVRSVGGTLLIIGNTGAGTRIKVSIPLKKKEEL